MRAVCGSNKARQVCRRRFPFFALVLTGLLLMVSARIATAKTLYVIAENVNTELQIPIHAYDVESNGKLTFQAKGYAPLYGARALALAVDSDSQHLFLACMTSNIIALLDAITLEDVGAVQVEGARSLTGVVYDRDKQLLYCVDRATPKLYAYRWNSTRKGLIPVSGSPFTLENADAYGIALDEVKDEVYVSNQSTSVGVYSTLDWHLIKTISVGRVAMSVAVDPVRGYLYYGGANGGNLYLGRHDLAGGTERELLIGPKIGVMGLVADPATGFVFASTGHSECPGCGDDVLVFNGNLVLVHTEFKVGDPAGLVVSEGYTPYNPLRLTKTVKTPAGHEIVADRDLPQVIIGEEFTYSICFDHNDLPLTEVSLTDTLPAEMVFVRATGDGVYGQYDSRTHTYTWSNPPSSKGPTTWLELVCRVDPNVSDGRILTNWATIDARETSPTTASVEVVTVAAKVYKPLRVSKAAIAGVTGGSATTPASANAGDEVTYRISFDNRSNAYPVVNVLVSDELPRQTTFVRATGNGVYGRYEPLTRTYVWSYPRLAPGESNSVDLVVRLDRDATPGATITNAVTAKSDYTLAARASVDIKVASYAYTPLGLQKTLTGGGAGPLDDRGRPYVDLGETLTYAISFSNPPTNGAVTQVSLTDTLPRDVTFVSADGDRDFGSYNSSTRTYTWQYASLAPGAQKSLNLVVRVNDKVGVGTVISNLVTIAGKQTVVTTAGKDVVVRAAPGTYAPLGLQKTLAQGAVGGADGKGRLPVNAGTILTYAICFSNPAANKTVTGIFIVDTLPREVSFVSADGDRDFGSYDSKTNTYTWQYPSLEPGRERCLNLLVRVNDKVDPDALIVNSATVGTAQTSTTTAHIEVAVRAAVTPPPGDVKGQMYTKPDHIYRNDSTAKAELMVVVHLPEGIGMAAISNTPLVLTPGNVKATGQQIFGTSLQGKVLCFFDVDPILAATQGYGQFTIKAAGKLNDGRSFVGEDTIWILKFGGP